MQGIGYFIVLSVCEGSIACEIRFKRDRAMKRKDKVCWQLWDNGKMQDLCAMEEEKERMVEINQLEFLI